MGGKSSSSNRSTTNNTTNQLHIAADDNAGTIITAEGSTVSLYESDHDAIENALRTVVDIYGESMGGIEGAYTGALQFSDASQERAFEVVGGGVVKSLDFADQSQSKAFDAIQGAYTGALQFSDVSQERAFGVVDGSLAAVQGATAGAFELVDQSQDHAFEFARESLTAALEEINETQSDGAALLDKVVSQSRSETAQQLETFQKYLFLAVGGTLAVFAIRGLK